MKKKEAVSNHVNANANTNQKRTTKGKITMTTKKASKTTGTTNAITSTTTEAVATTPPGNAAAASIIFVQHPPKDANIPVPPPGFVPTPGNDNRGLLPKKAHMAAIPDALSELDRFTDYDRVFGMTAPPLEYTKSTLGAAGQWSLQRAQLRAWDLYCRTHEGLAWRGARLLIDRMGPAFALATATDSTVAQRYPGFARLFGASKQIAQKGALTRKANSKLKAEGKAPNKGGAAKAKEKQAARAALEAQLAAAAAGGGAARPAATGAAMAPVSLVTPVSLVVPTAPVAPVVAAQPAAATASAGAPVGGGVVGASSGSAQVAGAQGATGSAVAGGGGGAAH